MNCNSCEQCPAVLAFRWAGRVLGLATFGFLAWFVAAYFLGGRERGSGDGHPLTAIELTLAVMLACAAAGMVIGWRWEIVGGLLTVGGMALFIAIEFAVHGTWPRGWLIWWLAAPGLLYLAASGFDRCRARQLRMSQSWR